MKLISGEINVRLRNCFAVLKAERNWKQVIIVLKIILVVHLLSRWLGFGR